MFVLPSSPYLAEGYPISDADPADPDERLWLSISLVQTKECAEGFDVSMTPCMSMLHAVLDSCNTDSTSEKFGGSIVYGCGIYEMRTSKGSATKPPKGYLAEQMFGWNGI
jgi:hypothetical protein